MLVPTLIRTGMAVAGIVLVYRFAQEERAGRVTSGGWPDYILLNLVLLSIMLHFGLNVSPRPVLVHSHDIFHYYMGSKYSREVGYLDLYQSAAVADWENTGPSEVPYRVRRMDDYSFVSSQELVRDHDRYRALFSDERWEEFKADIAVFRSELTKHDRWRSMFRDNGYNATPVWNMVAREITNRISVQWRPGLLLLACFDAALLVLMFVVMRRSFSDRTTFMAIAFLGCLLMMAPGTIRGAFLRLDWLALLVMATCSLKVQRYKTAGALLAYAGAARIFPLILAFGLAAKCVWDLVATHKVDRRYLQFFMTFALVVIALFTLSLIGDGGTDSWRAFWTKISFHDTHMSALRVGFKPLLLAGVAPVMKAWPSSPGARAARFGELQGIWWTVQALVLAGSFLAVRRLEDYETLPFGCVIVYFLTAPTFYYQVMLVALSLLFLPKLAERWRAHGMAMLFGISIVGYALWAFENLDILTAREWRRVDYTICLSLAAMLLLMALYVIGFSLYRPAVPGRGQPADHGIGSVAE